VAGIEDARVMNASIAGDEKGDETKIQGGGGVDQESMSGPNRVTRAGGGLKERLRGITSALDPQFAEPTHVHPPRSVAHPFAFDLRP
jgi:hypothetical protein